MAFLDECSEGKASRLLKYYPMSKSQLAQDLLVLYLLDFKTKGYFVEFGATDGIKMSNTYLLEKQFGWFGILAEPAKVWHKELVENRECHIEKLCVWTNSDSLLEFNEFEIGEYSGLKNQNNFNGSLYSSYLVKTISLGDLLEKFNAPKEIDYLSIDTEGSEYDILLSFDFDKYDIKIISCEHNLSENREMIYKLLSANGYVRIYEQVSRWDDWYIKV
ncbi:methyltransferase, FkbM family [Flavobacteriaceae bacterium MAR_2010_188]|nr:methyltransferase, FkbM family [Flavobacteriaceae bacterium MAR_2010_188]